MQTEFDYNVYFIMHFIKKKEVKKIYPRVKIQIFKIDP